MKLSRRDTTVTIAWLVAGMTLFAIGEIGTVLTKLTSGKRTDIPVQKRSGDRFSTCSTPTNVLNILPSEVTK